MICNFVVRGRAETRKEEGWDDEVSSSRGGIPCTPDFERIWKRSRPFNQASRHHLTNRQTLHVRGHRGVTPCLLPTHTLSLSLGP